MSTDYYAICETHGKVVCVTDNKGNPPPYPEKVLDFMLDHSDCVKRFVTDSEISIEGDVGFWKIRDSIRDDVDLKSI